MKIVKYLLFIVCFAVAGMPENGMLMLSTDSANQITSKIKPRHDVLSFEELIDVGVNVIHFQMYSKLGLIYTTTEWVKEAHEYGFWVCGGVGNFGMIAMDLYIGELAAIGVDFMEMNIPLMGWENECKSLMDPFGEQEFNQLKSTAAKACKYDSCPVFITDVACNNSFNNWSSVDGLFQQIDNNHYYNTYYPLIHDYKSANPLKLSGAWVWMRTKVLNQPDTITDAQFDTWFEDVYTKTGNVGLFRWNDRYALYDTIHGTNWDARVATIKRVVNKSGAIPEWKDFSPSGPVSGASPDCQIQVRCQKNGLDPLSVECYYAVDPVVYYKTKWIKHDRIEVTGVKGTKDWVTITAKGVPFQQVSDVLNKIRFKITNTYSGTWFRNAQTFKRDYVVNVTALDWSGGRFTVDNAGSTINVQSADGLDVTSAKCEFSADHGKSWSSFPAHCTGESGTTVKEVISVSQLPIGESNDNSRRVRFSIQTINGKLLKSLDFPVNWGAPPVFNGVTAIRSGDSSLDFSLKVKDNEGLKIASRESSVKGETISLYHFNGNAENAAGNNPDAVLYGDAAVVETADWKTGGGNGKALYLDGNDDYADLGFVNLNRSGNLTISTWVNAQNATEAIDLGGVEYLGSLVITFLNNQVKVQGRNLNRELLPFLLSDKGSFSYNKWYHVAVSCDGDTGSLYINGNLAASQNWDSFILQPDAPFMLGRPSNRSRFFKGYFDEVHLVNEALTAEEIACEYYSGMYRISKDGGESWLPWSRLSLSGQSGVAEINSLFLYNVPLGKNKSSQNKIQFAMNDINGFTGSQVYTVADGDVISVQRVSTKPADVWCYPNPFVTQTHFGFELGSPDLVSVQICSMNGGNVKTFQPLRYNKGKHTLQWDGKGNNQQALAAGQYFARITIGNRVVVKKLLLMK
ncbi:MAG: T9SS type A sorting domain-containing protein [Fibrobacteria bacterium]|nr:T9SS type A sorting domain-containing protein [Fibrobacteria bacterium]